MVSVSVDSVRLMRRIAIATVEIKHRVGQREQRAVSQRAGAGIGDEEHADNPTTSADQRWTPTRSLRMRIDSSVVKSGAEN